MNNIKNDNHVIKYYFLFYAWLPHPLHVGRRRTVWRNLFIFPEQKCCYHSSDISLYYFVFYGARILLLLAEICIADMAKQAIKLNFGADAAM